MAMMRKVGHYSFLVGLLLALVLALFSTALNSDVTSIMMLGLVILGVLVGFLNITAKEVTEFLVAAIALIVMASISQSLVVIDMYITGLGTLMQSTLSFIAVFVAPAALIVAIKAIIKLAEEE
ncbi:hypothetical protein COV19_02755 [Candidatus Woesearchaeota archaeon CG10_big_fil_rev_8_21_14_0_10_44_13]|nr:MAG: hypothetical protein COV19_02755 [Candidatus Woesearchaeota archaeon CG10_big_fil_rev_8_21_14_0_10_44_13]